MSSRKIRKIAKKVNKINRKEEVAVAISRDLINNKELIEAIESYKVKVLDGRWLLKFFIYDIVKYIADKQNERIETLTLAILINDIEEVIFTQLIQIAKCVKVLKVVTNRPSKFSYIENKLYDDYGIAIQVTNNKEKAISNTNIIINFDFNEDQINKYNLLENSIIINIKNKVKINNPNFCGNILNNYTITCNENILNEFNNKSNFDRNVLYEGLVYRKDSFLNIQKQFELDGVRLENLIA